MPIYRALRNMHSVAKRGELTRLTHLNDDQIAKLERVGAVARISPPPLSELPGWSKRAVRLEPIGVVDLEQLLEAEPEALSKALRVKPETVKHYQQELVKFLTIEEDAQGG